MSPGVTTTRGDDAGLLHFASIHEHMHICVHTHVCTHKHIYTHARACTHTHTRTCSLGGQSFPTALLCFLLYLDYPQKFSGSHLASICSRKIPENVNYFLSEICTFKKLFRDFPGRPVVKTPCFHWGAGSIPGQGTKISHAAWHGQKKYKINK